jgi:hypothetical protein
MARPPTDPDDTVPEPGAEPSAAEKAQARAFGDLIDKALAGRTPPAMPAGDRDLLEVATIIRAVSRPAELSGARAAATVEAALRQAVGDQDRPSVSSPDIAPPGGVRTRSRLPWVIAVASTAVAAAAVILLLVGRGGEPGRGGRPTARDTAAVPAHWRSRPADDLIGAIPKERSGDAVSRIDAIYADRLGGYRERTLAGRTHRRSTP